MREGRVCIPFYLHVLVMGTLKIMWIETGFGPVPCYLTAWAVWWGMEYLGSHLRQSRAVLPGHENTPRRDKVLSDFMKNRQIRSSGCFLNAFVPLHLPQQWHWNIPLAITWGRISFPECWNVQSIQTSDGWKKSRGTVQFLFKSQCSGSVASKPFVFLAMSR